MSISFSSIEDSFSPLSVTLPDKKQKWVVSSYFAHHWKGVQSCTYFLHANRFRLCIPLMLRTYHNFNKWTCSYRALKQA